MDCSRKFQTGFCGSVALLLLASSCDRPPADTRAADESTVRDLDAQWSKTAATKDLDATVAYYTEDAQLLPPNAPIAIGKKAIREVWTTLIGPNVSVSWQVGKVEVARSGDLAYMVGTYRVDMKDPHGKPSADVGKLIEVWKKQADGKWKVVADTFNSDLPEAAASAK